MAIILKGLQMDIEEKFSWIILIVSLLAVLVAVGIVTSNLYLPVVVK